MSLSLKGSMSMSLEACENLEALGELSTAVNKLNGILEKFNQHVDELDPYFRKVDKKLTSLQLPFQMSVFEYLQAQDENGNQYQNDDEDLDSDNLRKPKNEYSYKHNAPGFRKPALRLPRN
mmetsp:Transcript_5174/g.6529  ORF Transcript_5174/g.6529 Transcript_5174/m.6529 type:complete len:121 (+) Transcript_5174:435-797(+)